MSRDVESMDFGVKGSGWGNTSFMGAAQGLRLRTCTYLQQDADRRTCQGFWVVK